MSLARERSDRAGEGVGWVVGTFLKIIVTKLHFKALKNDFLGNETYTQNSRQRNLTHFFPDLKFLLVNFPHTE